MPITIDCRGDSVVAVCAGGDVPLHSVQDTLDLLVTARYEHDTGKLAVAKDCIDESFFDLRSGLAGELLQKIINYGGSLAIYGDITPHTERSKALRDFVRESNRGGRIHFCATLAQALDALHE